uniref:Uncharacterized protein n=1 Tax=Rhizophora mucronata TaxID=61149 RepID=A0A2P2PIX8_RHIMU
MSGTDSPPHPLRSPFPITSTNRNSSSHHCGATVRETGSNSGAGNCNKFLFGPVHAVELG